jgi:hypothetical protein
MELKMKDMQDQHAKQQKTNIMEHQEKVLAQFFVCRGKKSPTKSFGQGNVQGQRAS